MKQKNNNGFCLDIKQEQQATFHRVKNGHKLLISHGKKTGFIPCFNLPALITCAPGVPCSKICYACKGHYNYKNVKQAYKNNLNYITEFTEQFETHIHEYLSIERPAFFRWFSSGDIPSKKFFNEIVKIARLNPWTQFLVFTKRFAFVNSWVSENGIEQIPQNLVIRFSAWDKKFSVPNPYNFPIFYVNFKKNNKYGWETPEKAVNASPCRGACVGCFKCWSHIDVIENQR